MKTSSRLLVLVFATFSCSTFAANNSYFYAAAGAGIFQGDFNNAFIDHTDAVAVNVVSPANQHGYVGEIALGYRRSWCERYFLGAELSGFWTGHTASYQIGAAGNNFSDQNQIQYYGDLTFVPGLMLNETISAYLKVGLSYAALQDNLSSPSGAIPVSKNYMSNRNPIGLALGLGVSKAITERVSIFTEANYHDYGTVTFSDFQNFEAAYTHTAHVYSYSLVAGAAYKFC